MIIAIACTWKDMLNIGGKGGFTFIQKYTGYISPGVFAMFMLGMFWKRTTGAAAIVGVLSGFLLSVFFNEFAPASGYTKRRSTRFTPTASWPRTASTISRFPSSSAWAGRSPSPCWPWWSSACSGPRMNPKAFEIDRSDVQGVAVDDGADRRHADDPRRPLRRFW